MIAGIVLVPFVRVLVPPVVAGMLPVQYSHGLIGWSFRHGFLQAPWCPNRSNKPKAVETSASGLARFCLAWTIRGTRMVPWHLLHCAAYFGHADSVASLVRRKAKLEAMDWHGVEGSGSRSRGVCVCIYIYGCRWVGGWVRAYVSASVRQCVSACVRVRLCMWVGLVGGGS